MRTSIEGALPRTARQRRIRPAGAIISAIGLALASVVVATNVSGATSRASRTPIKIGVIFPLSGALGPGGIDNLDGVQIAVHETNAAGGVAGHKIVLDVMDGPDDTTAASDATKLIAADHVKEIIGTVLSDLALAAAPVANRNHVIYWEVEAVANTLTGMGFKYLFRVPPDSYALGSTAAKYAVNTIAPKLGIPVSKLKVGVISVTGAYGAQTTYGVVNQLKKLGIRPVANLSYDPASTSLDSLILKLKSTQPDIIVATSYAPDSILFTNEAEQLGFHYKALIGTGAGQTPIQFEQGLGATANGILSSSFAYDVSNSSLMPAARAQNVRFIRDFQQAYGHAPDIGAYLAYVGTVDLLTVMNTAGGSAPGAVRSAALKISLPIGSSVNGWGLRFTSTGQNQRSPVTVTQWQNKVLKVIAPSNAATAQLNPSIMAH